MCAVFGSMIAQKIKSMKGVDSDDLSIIGSLRKLPVNNNVVSFESY
jgi:hypothetical protein